MPNTDPRIDAYIEKAADFAKPILQHLRSLVHKACPQVEETVKWSFPHFDYKGEMMCSMASFKQHCVFGFWKAALMKDPLLVETAKSEVAMGHLGRITSLKDLPGDKKIIAWIYEAMELNDKGIKVIKAPAKPLQNIEVPDYFLKAIKKNTAAKIVFEAFSPSAKKEYVMWLEEAKTEATRLKRLEQAIEWIAEGKQRHWKYMKS
jgi:uncharacterized protein YdeI (YjbR/CyaY-like superfamily)